MPAARLSPLRRPTAVLVTALTAVLVLAGAACGSDRRAVSVARRDPQVERDVVYRVVGNRRLRLDVYRPASTRARAIGVLVVHGGAWVTGSRALLDWEGESLARDGFTAFAIDYRLAPRDRFPAALDDVRAALAWVRAHADDYGIVAHRIGALGLSAGGNLVTLLATRGHHAGLAAGVSWSGPTDLTAAGAEREPGLRSYIADYLGCAPATCPARARGASPIFHVSRRPPPMLLVNSTDELVSRVDFDELKASLRAAHGSVETLLLPGDLHAEQYLGVVWSRTVAFLADRLQANG